jgi:hypothetical protein
MVNVVREVKEHNAYLSLRQMISDLAYISTRKHNLVVSRYAGGNI